MGLAILPGDVLVRDGVVNAFGRQYNALSSLIGENYNHAGVALDAWSVHHVESNGYETIPIRTFFSCKNAAKGGVIRFEGPGATQIRSKVVEIAKKKLYPKIPGNPFSTSLDTFTVNCNEFILSLYKQAIYLLIAENTTTNRSFANILAKHYTKSGPLISPRKIHYEFFGALGARTAWGAETVGSTQADHPDVKIQFEGTVICTKPFLKYFCWESEVILHTYTPGSFIGSKWFRQVEKVQCLK